MSTQAHTPTPLCVAPSSAHDILTPDGYRYARAYGEAMDQRAAHIVKCVNAHDELVAALREIVAMTDEDNGTFRKRGGTYRGLVGIVARAALVKVQS